MSGQDRREFWALNLQCSVSSFEDFGPTSKHSFPNPIWNIIIIMLKINLCPQRKNRVSRNKEKLKGSKRRAGVNNVFVNLRGRERALLH